MLSIRAIPQRHRGIQFRSRTEARWAEYFSQRSIDFEYEPEGYQLDSGWYVPDFRLPHTGVFFEVKAGSPNEREVLLATDLAKSSGAIVVISAGNPSSKTELIGFDARGRVSRLFLVPDFYATAWLATSVTDFDLWCLALGPNPNGRLREIDWTLDEVANFQFSDPRRSGGTLDWRDRERAILDRRVGLHEDDRRVVRRSNDERRVVRR